MSDFLVPIVTEWQLEQSRTYLWPRELRISAPQNDLITVLTGVRRCGKSTILSQMAEKWNIPFDHCYRINFEDPRLVDHLTVDLFDSIVSYARKQKSVGPLYFFFDELQVVKHWQKWLRLKTDNPGADYFVITGSNARLLAGELSTVLTGRHLSFELFPFSWSEYQIAFPTSPLEEYLKKGGFPRALRDDEPTKLLGQYFADIVEKDIRERLNARSAADLRRTIKVVFESVGSEISLRRLSAALHLSVDTLNSYLDAAENAYLCFCCNFFSYSERQRSHRNKKYYAIDTGLRRAVITPTGQDLGKDFENLVFITLRKQYREVYYWKGSKEVDFVVETNDGPQPIQVSWDGIKERHEIALTEFYREFKSSLDPIYVTRESFSSWYQSVNLSFTL